MHRIRHALLTVFILPLSSFTFYGAEADPVESMQWEHLLIALVPFSESADYKSKEHCVISGRITQAIPEVDPIRIRRVHYMVQVDGILKPIESQPSSENEDTLVQYVEKSNVALGDTVCISMPPGFSPNQIGTRTDSLVFVLRRGINRLKLAGDTLRELRKLENPNDVKEDELADAQERAIARRGLAAIPPEAKWWECYDAGLIKSVGWDAFFNALEYESDLLDLNGKARQEFADRLKELTYPECAKFVVFWSQKVPSSELKLSAAAFLVRNGDPRGVTLYVDAIQFMLNSRDYCSRMEAYESRYADFLRKRRKAKRDLTQIYLADSVAKLREVLSNHSLPDPNQGVDFQELRKWCAQAASFTIERSTEPGKFYFRVRQE